MIPANLTEARNLALVNAWVIFVDAARVVRTQLEAFLSDLVGLLDPNVEIQRALLNWIPIGRELADTLPTTHALERFNHANDAGLIFFRISALAAQAETDGLISAALANSIRTAYINRWT